MRREAGEYKHRRYKVSMPKYVPGFLVIVPYALTARPAAADVLTA